MFKRIAQPLGLLLLSWSSVLHALGLGEIEVQSQLNQPLRATIALPSATAAELETLVVKVAPNSAFDRAGIELAAYVSSLQFEVVREGTPSVRVTSTELAREPFLSFLVEARWAGGRILREYTVLLDPPNLAAASAPAEPTAQPTPAPATQAAKPAAPVAKPAAPVISQPAEPVFYEEDPAAVPPATRRYSTERESPKPQAAPAPSVTAATAPAASTSTYGPVKRQETLWSIAYKLRPDPKSVTMDQMLIALFESNQEAFGGDINGLRTGSMLTVPPLLDIVAVDPVEAKRRVDAARQRGAAAPATAAAKPRSVTPVAPKRPTPPPVEREREPEPEPELEPEPEPKPKPVAPTAGSRASAPDASSALAQLQAMAGQNSGQPAAGQSPEPELEPEPVPEVSEPFEEEPLAEAPEEIEEELGPEPEPEVEVVEPVAAAPVVEEPASGGLPWMGIGLGLLILILGGAGWVVYKRRGQAKEQAVPAAAAAATTTAEADDSEGPDEPSFEEVAAATAIDAEDEAEDTAAFEAVADDDDELMDETQSLPDDLDAEPAEGAADEVDFDVTAQFQADTMQINLDANDPVSEADFHLAYGLYDEAALLLQQAQEREPGRQDIKIKLAETYFAGGKTEEFLDSARNLKGELPDAEWQKIAIMGGQIAGDDPLFQDAGEAAAEGVDLDFGGDEAAPAEGADDSASADAAAATEDDNSLSFDLDLDAEPTPAPKSQEPAPAADRGDDNALEFDLGDFDLEMDEADDTKSETPSSEQSEKAEADSGIESLDLDSLDMGSSNDLADETLTSGGRNEPSLDIGDFGLDELDAPTESSDPPATDSATDRKEPTLDEDQAAELDFADLGLDDDSAEPGISDGDEASTKLDLARAYIDMGDNEMAKGLLDEVVTQGSDEQKAAAEELIQRLPSA